MARLPVFDPDHERARGSKVLMWQRLVFSLAVLLGDSVTSFFKRRLGLVSGEGTLQVSIKAWKACSRLLVVQHRFDLVCRVSSASS
jgi:hypothetical protein